MPHPLLRLFLAAQREEGFAFQVKDVLLGNPLRLAQVAAGEHVGQFVGNVGFVFGDVAAFVHGVNRHLQRRQHIAPGGINLFGDGRVPAAFQHVQDFALGFRDQVVAVHHHPVGGRQDAPRAGLLGAGGDLRHADLLKRPLHEGQHLRVFGAHGRVDDAADDFLGAAARGNHARPDFHQADVKFRRGHRAGSVHGDFAAAAQRQPGRRGHHRLVEVAHPHVQILKRLHRGFQLLPHALLSGQHHREQVGARAEVVGVAADDNAFVLARIYQIKRLVEHVENVLVQGVHLGVKFHINHAVAQVNDSRARVFVNHLARGLLFLDENGLRRAADGLIRLLRGVVNADLAAAVVLVEGGEAGGQHIVHPLRRGEALFRHRVRGFGHAQHVPNFKGAGLVGEAPAHGVVYRLGGVSNFGDDRRGVGKALVEHRTHQLRGAVVFFHPRAQALAQILNILDFAHRLKLGLAGRLVFQGFQIEVPVFLLAILLDLLVKALLGLVAQPAALDEFGDEFVGALRSEVFLRHFVVGNGLPQVAADVVPNVNAHQIHQAESSSLGAAHQRAGDGVHFLHGVAVLKDVIQHERAAAEGNAVADEVGGILAEHHALAEAVFAEFTDEFHHLGQGVGVGDDLQQFEVAGRVEEVGAQEVLAEAFGAPGGDVFDGDAGGVGAHDGVRRADGVNARHELLFDVQPLHHYLNHPVGMLDGLFQVVFQVAEGNQRGVVFGEERGGLGLQRPLKALPHDAVADFAVLQSQALLFLVGGKFPRHNIQQSDGHTGVGEVSGDSRPHGARADDRRAADLVFHEKPPWKQSYE